MTQIQYGDELVSQLGINKTGQLARRPLTVWRAFPMQIGGTPYYLYLEQASGMPLVTRELDNREFSAALAAMIEDADFLTDYQKDRLHARTADFVSFRYHQAPLSFYAGTCRRILSKHQEEFQNVVAELANATAGERSLSLAEGLLHFMGIAEQNQIFSAFIQVVNDQFPMRTAKPRPGSKYCNRQATFIDPRQWANLASDPQAADQATIKKMQANNQQMVKQYLSTFKSGADIKGIQAILLDYLNGFLLAGGIKLVTNNLALANVYYWSALINGDLNADLIADSFIGFYNFLSQTGTIRQSDAKKVAQFIMTTMDNVAAKQDEMETEPSPEDSYLATHLEEMQHLLTDPNVPARTKKFIKMLLAKQKK